MLKYYAIYHLNKTQAMVQKSNIQQALNHLDKAAESKLKEVDKKYPDITLITSVIIPALPDNPDLMKAYLSFLRGIDYDYLKEIYASKWAKIYYFFGLTAHEHNELDLVIPFWQVAVNLAPEWSYFHTELANYYLIQGEIDKARSQIEYCLQFHFPQAHCRQFMEENVQTNSPETVGFWEKQVKDI
jgi:tetratricopeptide (TPR) repeat protein